MGKLRKIGKKIGRGFRKIGRALKKGFGKFTKAFGKLGPLGHIAMSLILPGLGGVLGSWMKTFGSNVLKFLPKGFQSILTEVGRAVANGASTMYKNTVGVIHKTITGGIEWGLNQVSNLVGTPEGMGLGDKFSNFMETLNQKMSGLKPTNEYTVLEGDNLSTIAEQTGVSLEQLKTLNPEIVDPNLIKTGQTINIKGSMPIVPDKDSPLDKLKAKKIGDTTVGEVAKTGKDITTVATTINSLTADDDEYENPFFNRNIGDANDLLYNKTYDTIAGSGVQFINLQKASSYDSLVNQYLQGSNLYAQPQDAMNVFDGMSPIGYNPYNYVTGVYDK